MLWKPYGCHPWLLKNSLSVSGHGDSTWLCLDCLWCSGSSAPLLIWAARQLKSLFAAAVPSTLSLHPPSLQPVSELLCFPLSCPTTCKKDTDTGSVLTTGHAMNKDRCCKLTVSGRWEHKITSFCTYSLHGNQDDQAVPYIIFFILDIKEFLLFLPFNFNIFFSIASVLAHKLRTAWTLLSLFSKLWLWSPCVPWRQGLGSGKD